MDIMQAIDERISCRAFDERTIEEDLLDQLSASIAEINKVAGIRMVLVRPEDGGTNLKLAGAMFSGQPHTYIALFARDDEHARDCLGYYGEKVILQAVQLGISSCWVAGTYDTSSVQVPANSDEVLCGVIPLGYAPSRMPLKQRTVRTALRKRNKKPTQIYAGYDSAPRWIKHAIDTVIKAPSAVNGQPVVFIDTPKGIKATVPNVKSGVEYFDLGIARLHFELGAADEGTRGSWNNDNVFVVEQYE